MMPTTCLPPVQPIHVPSMGNPASACRDCIISESDHVICFEAHMAVPDIKAADLSSPDIHSSSEKLQSSELICHSIQRRLGHLKMLAKIYTWTGQDLSRGVAPEPDCRITNLVLFTVKGIGVEVSPNSPFSHLQVQSLPVWCALFQLCKLLGGSLSKAGCTFQALELLAECHQDLKALQLSYLQLMKRKNLAIMQSLIVTACDKSQ